eukprot:CAMPEP_0184501352 /NCGR_PEP_ID=MMETSP0113_2-20130426/47427_1 /TAXON_ID=91329 /ORGANISM="Norrisiella sphaerica, Strain BC52" /LENGTH=383 /DNA_ID=CAMNT_0026890085 /DNA_START=153 /DNA_END=1304 /DNA_ORIENTATION=-
MASRRATANGTDSDILKKLSNDTFGNLIRIAVPLLCTLLLFYSAANSIDPTSPKSFVHGSSFVATTEVPMLKWIPEKTQDPRQVFAHLYPDVKKDWTCVKNPYSIRSQDDVKANMSTCTEATRMGLGIVYKNPRKLNETVIFAEVYKAASSTITRTLARTHYCPPINHATMYPVLGNCIVAMGKGLQSPADTKDAVAFTFVRHPVERFVSGYRQIFQMWNRFYPERKKKKTPVEMVNILNMEEPARFHKIVDLFVTKGIGIIDPLISGDRVIPNFNEDELIVGFAHIFSQMWYISQYPGEISYIGKVEDLEDQLAWVRTNLMGLRLDSGSAKLKNAHLASREPKFGCPSTKDILSNRAEYQFSLDKLNIYFAREMEFFGYQPL